MTLNLNVVELAIWYGMTGSGSKLSCENHSKARIHSVGES